MSVEDLLLDIDVDAANANPSKKPVVYMVIVTTETNHYINSGVMSLYDAYSINDMLENLPKENLPHKLFKIRETSSCVEAFNDAFKSACAGVRHKTKLGYDIYNFADRLVSLSEDVSVNISDSFTYQCPKYLKVRDVRVLAGLLKFDLEASYDLDCFISKAITMTSCSPISKRKRKKLVDYFKNNGTTLDDFSNPDRIERFLQKLNEILELM